MTIQRRISRKTENNLTRTIVTEIQQIPFYEAGPTTRIALLQPGSWGDNINSTLMFKPLRAKWPDCTIDVFTSTSFGSAFHNNPYIHHLHETPSNTKQEALHQLVTIRPLLENRGYNAIFCPHPMVNPDKWTAIKSGLGPNLICAWVRALEDADIPYELPLETILKLTHEETSKVDRFCKPINMERRNILMEVQGESGQTFWNNDWTMRVSRHLISDPNTNLFISRRHTAEDILELSREAPGRVHFAGGLSIRECAELFNRCDIFFSVSSGLSNACNTNWCKKNGRWIETVNGDGHGGSVVNSAPIRSEGKIFWYDNDLGQFLQMLRNNNI